jgi:hypothetical protein
MHAAALINLLNSSHSATALRHFQISHSATALGTFKSATVPQHWALSNPSPKLKMCLVISTPTCARNHVQVAATCGQLGMASA